MKLSKNTFVAGLLVGCLCLSGCSKTPVGELASALSDEDNGVRYEAAKQLAKYGPEAVEAVDELAVTLADPDPRVRYRSAKALSKIGIGAAPAADSLVLALNNADDEMRYYLVKTLANIEDAAVGAVEELKQILQSDTDARNRYYAAKALGKIGKEARDATTALEAAGKDPDKKVRKAAGEALEKVRAS